MDRIEDPRICFFLEHQERIKEWADLRPGASQAAHEFLVSLTDDFDTLDLAAQQGMRTYRRTGRWPAAFFCFEHWITEPPAPRVGIGLMWDRNNALFKLENTPYIGVRVEVDQKGGPELAKLLHREIGEVISDTEFEKGGANSHWPAIKYEKAQGAQYWKDLSKYRTQLRNRVAEAWKLFSPVVDKAVKEIRS